MSFETPALSIRRRWFVLLCLGAFVAAVGCSQGDVEYHLSGNVTFKGKPVPDGNIVFEPAGSGGAPGMSKIKDGKYDTRWEDGHGTQGGPHRIRIVGMDGKRTGNEKGEILPGTPMFPEYETEVELPKEDSTKDFAVP